MKWEQRKQSKQGSESELCWMQRSDQQWKDNKQNDNAGESEMQSYTIFQTNQANYH